MHDVRLYIENKRIRSKDRLPVNLWNPKLAKFRGKITATDVDHAYWRIAFIMGVISDKTYQKGLLIKDKSIRLAALANLSSSKEYNIIKDGVVTKKTKVLKYDPILQKVYNNIRFTCYEHMTIMANMLGEDFICYKTDCIYYKDTPVNREMIQIYLDSVGLEWKQLIEPDRPKEEVE
jgi:aspartate carbamoyltransferase regulatory subunit